MISDVENERSRTQSGVVAAVGVAPERKPAYCCVPHAGGEVEQGVLSFRRVEPGIAAVWRWDNRSHRGAIANQTSTKTTEDSDGITLLR